MKSLTLVLCVVALLGSAASAFFYIKIGDTKTQLQQQVAQANTRTAELQAKLAEAGTQSEALQKRLAALDSDLGDAKSKITLSENRNVQLARDVDQLKNQITAKDDAAQALNTEIADLKSQIAKATLAAAAASPEEIERYKQTVATLQTRVTELEAIKSTAAVAAANGTSGGAKAAAGLEGKVVSVGNQNAFVVINLGSSQGVQVNSRFTVARGGTTLATAQVSSVEENYSIAQIAPDSLNGKLGKGDSATIVAQ